MITFRFIFLVLFLVFIELLFVPFPLAFIMLLLWFQFVSESDALISAFAAGMFIDIFTLAPLGTSSFVFMTLLFIAFLYKNKFQSHNFIFLGVMSFISILTIEYMNRDIFVFSSATLGLITTVVLGRLLFRKTNTYEVWYR